MMNNSPIKEAVKDLNNLFRETDVVVLLERIEALEKRVIDLEKKLENVENKASKALWNDVELQTMIYQIYGDN